MHWHDALNDEYHAWATYTQVLEDFGRYALFSTSAIRSSAIIQALQHLFSPLTNLTVPTNPWSAVNLSHYASAQAGLVKPVCSRRSTNVDLYNGS